MIIIVGILILVAFIASYVVSKNEREDKVKKAIMDGNTEELYRILGRLDENGVINEKWSRDLRID